MSGKFNLDNLIKPASTPHTVGGTIPNGYRESSISELKSLTNEYIRYVNKHGELEKGGTIMGLDGENVKIRLTYYKNGLKAYYTKDIPFSNIEKIYVWKKTDNKKSDDTSAKNETKLLSNPELPAKNEVKSIEINSDDDMVKIEVPKTKEEAILTELGDKILFGDKEEVKNKVEKIELEIGVIKEEMKEMRDAVIRLNDDLRKLFLYVKSINKKN
jgi:hypothetical protein